MLEKVASNKFDYDRLTPEEQQKRGILGRLVGVIADFKNPTRNERHYSEKLWDKVFEDPIMKEKIENKCCFGELGHPADRQETDMEKIAICLDGYPKKNEKGELVGVFNILNTPNGRILKTLCDYGCNIGVSSRGSGDIITTYNGDEVDPDTYECECWDAVLIPSVKKARPAYVNEGLERDNFKKALRESLSKETADNRKIAEEALKRLDIDYSDKSMNEDIKPNKGGNIEGKNIAADNAGADVVKSLQESLKRSKALQGQLETLQGKLSVCNAKEVKLSEALQRKAEESRSLQEQLNAATDELDSTKAELERQSGLVESYRLKIKQLSREQKSENSTLNESYKKSEERVQVLTEQINTLKSETSKSRKQLNALQESLENVKQDAAIKDQENAKKLSTTTKLAEQYKKIADTAINKYISFRANMIGVNSSEIKRRLTENYTFGDIDKICEDLSMTNLDMDALPFNLSKSNKGKKVAKIEMTESKTPASYKSGYDDDIDDQLVALAEKHSK